ncbi:hypothetical protein BLNAU_331 [Blattamonas nauphoetae]|uniref:C2H2-type domain-containing protein n=1 Tax=Blattamonas nauphoetae TaxID=2049346 RepID=A0ABQ9YL85_9EUKA|nr:hypothetical protein BLNAU_331 [Blattamonas nauphoetae]
MEDQIRQLTDDLFVLFYAKVPEKHNFIRILRSKFLHLVTPVLPHYPFYPRLLSLMSYSQQKSPVFQGCCFLVLSELLRNRFFLADSHNQFVRTFILHSDFINKYHNEFEIISPAILSLRNLVFSLTPSEEKSGAQSISSKAFSVIVNALISIILSYNVDSIPVIVSTGCLSMLVRAFPIVRSLIRSHPQTATFFSAEVELISHQNTLLSLDACLLVTNLLHGDRTVDPLYLSADNMLLICHKTLSYLEDHFQARHCCCVYKGHCSQTPSEHIHPLHPFIQKQTSLHQSASSSDKATKRKNLLNELTWKTMYRHIYSDSVTDACLCLLDSLRLQCLLPPPSPIQTHPLFSQHLLRLFQTIANFRLLTDPEDEKGDDTTPFDDLIDERTILLSFISELLFLDANPKSNTHLERNSDILGTPSHMQRTQSSEWLKEGWWCSTAIDVLFYQLDMETVPQTNMNQHSFKQTNPPTPFFQPHRTGTFLDTVRPTNRANPDALVVRLLSVTLRECCPSRLFNQQSQDHFSTVDPLLDSPSIPPKRFVSHWKVRRYFAVTRGIIEGIISNAPHDLFEEALELSGVFSLQETVLTEAVQHLSDHLMDKLELVCGLPLNALEDWEERSSQSTSRIERVVFGGTVAGMDTFAHPSHPSQFDIADTNQFNSLIPPLQSPANTRFKTEGIKHRSKSTSKLGISFEDRDESQSPARRSSSSFNHTASKAPHTPTKHMSSPSANHRSSHSRVTPDRHSRSTTPNRQSSKTLTTTDPFRLHRKSHFLYCPVCSKKYDEAHRLKHLHQREKDSVDIRLPDSSTIRMQASIKTSKPQLSAAHFHPSTETTHSLNVIDKERNVFTAEMLATLSFFVPGCSLLSQFTTRSELQNDSVFALASICPNGVISTGSVQRDLRHLLRVILSISQASPALSRTFARLFMSNAFIERTSYFIKKASGAPSNQPFHNTLSALTSFDSISNWYICSLLGFAIFLADASDCNPCLFNGGENGRVFIDGNEVYPFECNCSDHLNDAITSLILDNEIGVRNAIGSVLNDQPMHTLLHSYFESSHPDRQTRDALRQFHQLDSSPNKPNYFGRADAGVQWPSRIQTIRRGTRTLPEITQFSPSNLGSYSANLTTSFLDDSQRM